MHSETGQAPLARWAAGVPEPLPLPSPAQLHEAFLWSERRTVRKTATVSLHGNLYQVDASLVRCVVELVFDPFDLTGIEVRHKGRPAGKAVPFVIGRHRHAKTRSGDDEQREQPEPTGIDYLTILDTAHGAGLQAQINYAALIDPAPDSGSSGTGHAGPVPAARTTIMDDFRQVIDLDQLTSDDTITLARTAAEAIRGLNWATNIHAGLDQPSVAYDVLGALSAAAARLGQLFTQITRYLDRALAAGHLGHDLGGDPAAAVEAAVIFLADARSSAAALAGDIDAARQQLAAVNGRPGQPTRKDTP